MLKMVKRKLKEVEKKKKELEESKKGRGIKEVAPRSQEFKII